MIRNKTEAFGVQLAYLRKAKGLTQTQFGELVGLTQSAIGMYERGVQRVPRWHIEPFSKVLGITPDQFAHMQANADRYELHFCMEEVPEPYKTQLYEIRQALEQEKVAA